MIFCDKKSNLHERDGTDATDIAQLWQVIDEFVENTKTKNVHVTVEIIVGFQWVRLRRDSSTDAGFSTSDTAANAADITVCASDIAVDCYVTNCTTSTTYCRQTQASSDNTSLASQPC